MASLSPALEEKARKLEVDLLRAVAQRGQQKVAADLGIDDSTFSRWMNAERDKGLVRTCMFLASLGLRVERDDAPAYDPEYVAALETLAHVHIDRRRRESQQAHKFPQTRAQDLGD